MRRTPFAIGIAVLLAASAALACTSSAGTPSASPTGTPWSPPAGSATLSVKGLGTLACSMPHYCEASLVIGAEGSPAWTWELPLPGEPDYHQGAAQMRLTGTVVSLPFPIAPGRYYLNGARADISDYVPPGGQTPAADRFNEDTICTADLTIEASTQHVDVTVTYDGRTCQIAVVATSGPSPRPLES
jgi:hypothetical protein